MRVKKFFKDQLEGLLQLVYPPVCICCDGLIHHKGPLKVVCPDCLAQLKCVPDNFAQTEILDRLTSSYLTDVRIVWQFNEVVQAIIHKIKYQKGEMTAFRLGQLARAVLSYEGLREELDLVIPVPLYGGREKERGFNQSLMIARGIFAGSPLEISSRHLRRLRATRSQTEMGREERVINVKEAFAIPDNHELKEKRIVLVDDVVTTGATLNECAGVLKSAGAAAVYGLTLATPVTEGL